MYPPDVLLTLAAAGLATTAIASAAGLRAWRQWLELKRLEGDGSSVSRRRGGRRSELAGLRERVRRLEAIASGIEL